MSAMDNMLFLIAVFVVRNPLKKMTAQGQINDGKESKKGLFEREASDTGAGARLNVYEKQSSRQAEHPAPDSR